MDGAQTISGCHLCQRSGNVKWKCVSCQLLLCNTCKSNVHPKFKLADTHLIIDIKDVGTSIEYSYKEIEYGKCSWHINQDTNLYCKDCSSLVCPKCVSETHQQHVLVDTDQIYTEKESQLSNLIELYKLKITSNTNINKIFQNKYDESKGTIIKRKEDIAKILDDHSTKMLYQLEEKCKNTDFDSELEDLNKTLDILLKCRQSRRGDLLLDTLKTIQDTEIQHDLAACFPRFVMGRPISRKIIEKFGSFKEETVLDPNEEIILKLKSSHVTSLKMIKRIVEDLGGTFYVIDESSLYRVVLKKGEKLQTKKITDIKAFDISFFKCNEILIAMQTEGKIMILKQSLNMKLFHSFSGLLPRAIHRTKDDKVIVGVREAGELLLSPGEDCKRQIIILDINGLEENVFEYDKDGQRIVSMPMKIKTNSDDDMLIIDMISKLEGRIVFLTKNGNVSWVYNADESSYSLFKPWDLVVTSRDNAIISDITNQAFHILNSKGQLIKMMRSIDIGLSLPFSLLINQEGDLLVGTSIDDSVDTYQHKSTYIFRITVKGI
ncbi:Hypothetical predicted protein [Mytilus galloprovincialis]|uniref:B box-type domain-containing protein n=1 Tax=Mytilus galloprovincialis TaxID=29158 RepID=A0A8B6GTN8_MYTGA|nr:Hypothetical predicted protein [Mytilus galloprovincialis]VDI68889.1 Hypothetical predicted protein [Mytilus galloprovincialis]